MTYFYGEKPYREESQFVDKCLRRFAEYPITRLLELACGTGGHALHLHQLGYELTAIDSSPDMLAVARAKAAQKQVGIRFRTQDMRSLSTPEKPYDAVVCLFDSIGYVQTDSGLVDVFEGVRASLAENGLFVFEFWNAAAMIRGFDPVRVRRFNLNGRTIIRISETTLFEENSLARVAYSIYDLRQDHTYEEILETQTNRYFTVIEMNNWATRFHFTPLVYYAGFEEDTKITDDTWHILAVWKKLGTVVAKTPKLTS